HANSVLCPRLKRHELADLPSPSSPNRQQNIERLLAERCGTFETGSLKEMLSDHVGHPHGICRHRGDDDRSETTASMIVNCTAGTAAIGIGQPCTSSLTVYEGK